MSFGQRLERTFTASVLGMDRVSVVMNNIDIPSWHERSFWPIYDRYIQQVGRITSQTYRALDDLARTDETVGEQEAFENAMKIIAFRYKEQDVRREFFSEIGTSLNGVIALQFLQTEILLEMMESSFIYEQTVWRKFRFHPNAWPKEKFRAAKHNTIRKAINLTAQQEKKFFEIYGRYEQECDYLLGEKYTLYELFAGEASDFTPGLAKRLGYDLLDVMGRELRLKEKFFIEMSDALGSQVAARFLAWEDYYSLISKMSAWAEAP